MKISRKAMFMPLLLATTSLFGSNLFQEVKQEVRKPESNASSFINYNVNNPESAYSYTLGIELQGKYTLSPYLVATGGFSPTGVAYEESKAGPAYLESGDYFPKILTTLLVSNNDGGTIIHLNGSFEEKNIPIYSIYGTETTSLSIPNLSPSETGTQSYAGLSGKGDHRFGACQLGVSGYAIEHKNFSMTSIIGAQVSGFVQTSLLKGDKTETTCDVFNGQQTSIATGLFGNITSNLILDQSDESAVYISGSLNYACEVNFNSGDAIFYSANGEDKLVTKHCSLPKTTQSNYCSKEIALNLVSKPTSEDMSFLSLSLGVGADTNCNKNLLNLIYQNVASDISSSYAFLRLSLTM